MKVQRIKISFWRHKSKYPSMAQLYCRIIMGAKRAELGSTGITIQYDHWDGNQVSYEDPESMFKNEKLTIMRDQLMAIFNDLFRKREAITPQKIKSIYFGKSGDNSLIWIFDEYMKDSRTDPDRNLTKSSLEVYDNVRKKLIDFLISQGQISLLVEDFNLQWAQKYRRWMRSLPLQVKGVKKGTIGHSESYTIKSLQVIKNVLIWAKLRGHAEFNPLDGYRFPQIRYSDPVFLTEDDFNRLKAHRFEDKALQQIADVFIILCRSGFHYGDLLDFVAKHKTALQRGIDGEQWMIKDRIKTEVATRVPVFDEVKQIVAKYGGWEHLPLPDLVGFNRKLKAVALELGLSESLSSKAGRKTFADWCFNVKMLSTDAILVMMGRKSDKGLEVYGRPDERRVVAELARSQADYPGNKA